MEQKVYSLILFFTISVNCFSQLNNESSYSISYFEEYRSLKYKIPHQPKNYQLKYRYGIVCINLCKFREAEKVFLEIEQQYIDSPEFQRQYYNLKLALDEKNKAKEIYYRYKNLTQNSNKNNNFIIQYSEVATEINPSLLNEDVDKIQYFPFRLNNDKIKFLTQKEIYYSEPTNAISFKNYLTNEVVFTDPEFDKSKTIKQPDKGEGFNYQAFCLNKNQDKIYMTRYDGVGQRLVLCYSEKIEKRWTAFKILDICKKYPRNNFQHPMLINNETKLIFSSDIKNGFGGYDLWTSHINLLTGELEKIHNLGMSVNTSGNECYPTLYDDESFFYSSDGLFGYGGLDIYRIDYNQDSFFPPINLGRGINSDRDDYGLFYSKNNQTAYFTSNRYINNIRMYIDKIYKININIFNEPIASFEIKNPFTKVVELADNSINKTNLNQEASNKSVTNQTITNNTVIFEDIESNPTIKNTFNISAKLLYKDLEIPIRYTYCKIFDSNNEIVYSDYSNTNGEISLNIKEESEYTIEIPKFRTFIKKVLYLKSEDNNIYFPYSYKSIERKENTIPKEKVYNPDSKTPILKSYSKPKSLTKPSPQYKRKIKSRQSIKPIRAPRNILQNFN